MNCKLMLLNNYMRMCRIFRRERKKVLFESFNGKSYSDNVKAISEKLHEISPETKIVWSFSDVEKKKNIVPEYVECIPRGNYLKYFCERAQADVWVSNFKIMHTVKSEKQLYIQTWHGDRAFKKVLYDSGYKINQPLAESIKGYCDYAIAGSQYGVRQYRSAFKYDGEIVVEGTPRDDCLVNPSVDKIKGIKKVLNIKNDVKILLYAPTMRDTVKNNEFQKIQEVDLKATLTLLEKKYDCEWVCFIRAHSAVGGLSGIELSDKVIDASQYEDMADLLLISDMLITDYSSCAGDFALLKRPLVLFQSDRKEYEEKDRGFYFNMEDSPYYVAENQEELEKIILELDEEKAKENCKQILKFYDTNETGRASEIVASLIVGHLKKL